MAIPTESPERGRPIGKGTGAGCMLDVSGTGPLNGSTAQESPAPDLGFLDDFSREAEAG